MIVVLATLLMMQSCLAQNWFVQRHYSTTSCLGAPFSEAAGDGGPNPCSVASPCSPSASTPRDYLVTSCTGNAPSISITGGLRIEAFTGSNCDTMVSVSAYKTGSCISLPTASLRVVCGPNGAVQTSFSDTSCSNFSRNETLATGAPNTCALAGTGSVRYFCKASVHSCATVLLIFVVLVFCSIL